MDGQLQHNRIAFPEIIRVTSVHQPRLCVHGISQFLIKNIPGGDYLQSVKYVVFRHAIFLQ